VGYEAGARLHRSTDRKRTDLPRRDEARCAARGRTWARIGHDKAVRAKLTASGRGRPSPRPPWLNTLSKSAGARSR
jgi:hypothetical protein